MANICKQTASQGADAGGGAFPFAINRLAIERAG
jgi:hypothetical protein